jgi:hypothetical protein
MNLIIIPNMFLNKRGRFSVLNYFHKNRKKGFDFSIFGGIEKKDSAKKKIIIYLFIFLLMTRK